ncbi:hypothetical protein TNCV_2891381 [Trichonephila clavipes]|nr:hypothetical protein TNCV_2891381 [Trichonephila clavipes]
MVMVVKWSWSRTCSWLESRIHNLVPSKTHRVEELMHVKAIEVQTPHVAAVAQKSRNRSRQPMARAPHLTHDTTLSGTVHCSTNLSTFDWMEVDKFGMDLF